MNFEISAHLFVNRLPEINILKKSRPPRNVIKPNKTTICINNFFLFKNLIARREKIKIGIPKIEGIKEVTELLPLIMLIIIPHIIRKAP
tara:strand:+ start:167 stop:433 length:267 start_codon:yes stop_codon:yes gene_type:complete